MKRTVLYTTVTVAALLAGCRPTKESTHHERQETVVTAQRLDSVATAVMERDSVFVRDSIFVAVRGDTVLQYVERTRYRYRTKTDTVTRYVVRADTAYIERTVESTTERTRYPKAFAVALPLALVLLAVATYMYIRK